jgi:hypothetical protein
LVALSRLGFSIFLSQQVQTIKAARVCRFVNLSKLVDGFARKPELSLLNRLTSPSKTHQQTARKAWHGSCNRTLCKEL